MARRGLSPVIAVTIMTGIMLTIVAVALYFSTSLIDLNRQMMEYEYAKEQLTYAATALEQVAFGTGGARYVRFSLTSTLLLFERRTEQLEVKLSGGGGSCSLTLTPVRVRVCGGPLVTTVPQLLYPEGGSLSEVNRLVVGAGEPIVIVHEDFAGRACAFLETYRVRAFYSGVTYVYSGGSRVPYNFFVVHLLNVTFGGLGGSGEVPVVFRNMNVTVIECSFTSPTVVVSVKMGDLENSLTLEGLATAQGSVVVVKVSNVEVSTG